MLSEHQIRGRMAVSAAGSQCRGSGKRNIYLTDTGSTQARRARWTLGELLNGGKVRSEPGARERMGGQTGSSCLGILAKQQTRKQQQTNNKETLLFWQKVHAFAALPVGAEAVMMSTCQMIRPFIFTRRGTQPDDTVKPCRSRF